MIRSFIRAAWRSLLHHPLLTTINLLGLTLGVASSLLIARYLAYEWSYDRSVPNWQQVYRVDYETLHQGRAPRINSQCSALFKPSIEPVIPGIDAITRAAKTSRAVFVDDVMFEKRLLGLDPEAVEVFGLRAAEGSLALDGPGNVVLSPQTAKGFFVDENPIGRQLEITISDSRQSFQVVGLLEPFPPNSSLQFDLIIPYEALREEKRQLYSEGWGMSWSETFLRLEPGVSAQHIEQAINDHMLETGVQIHRETSRRYFRLQPLNTLHLALHNPRNLPMETSPTASLILLAIGIGILVVAGVNYTVLSLGHSLTRTREVGVRKVLGAQRGHLLTQTMLETGLLTIGAMALGYGLATWVNPLFNHLAQVSLQVQPDPATLISLFLVGIVMCIGVGLYPSLVVAGFSPVAAFRGEVRLGGKGRLRRTLLVTQLAVSICLLTTTLLMATQLHHILTSNLGFDSDQVVEFAFPNRDELGEQGVDRFRREVSALPGVLSVSGTSCQLGSYWLSARMEDENSPYPRIYANIVDPDYLPTLGIKPIRGRNFEWGREQDRTNGIIVNETFIKMFEDETHGLDLAQTYPGETVVGVVPDFHFTNLHHEIAPMVLTQDGSNWIPNGSRSVNYAVNPYVQRILVRLAPENIPRTMTALGDSWEEIFPDRVFEYTFLDEAYEQWYREDRRWIHLVMAAAIMTLLITLLGLIGATVMETAQRTREIGIRKVLGASTREIVSLFSRSLLFQTLLGALVGTSTAWWFIQRWSENFAERVTFTPLHFLLPLLLLAGVMFATVAGLVVAASNRNPADVIRQE